ncbi:hypothetical protein KKD19_02485 [Patescibacteria group bacterium]|nr:hypothetical protein [Patescibacteria group bacterium]MBU4512090.1 hypothetical protein [Patescibacteria group bacterium]MCG2693415.1 hypothetical protein [Candidatus Parcubacteria bacterium]
MRHYKDIPIWINLKKEKVKMRYFQAQTLQNQAEEVLDKAKEEVEEMILK